MLQDTIFKQKFYIHVFLLSHHQAQWMCALKGKVLKFKIICACIQFYLPRSQISSLDKISNITQVEKEIVSAEFFILRLVACWYEYALKTKSFHLYDMILSPQCHTAHSINEFKVCCSCCIIQFGYLLIVGDS